MDGAAPGELRGPVRVVAVRLGRAGRVYYFDPRDLPLTRGAWVVVETQRGLETGQVVVEPREVVAEKVVWPLRPVLRLATETDLAQRDQWQQKEQQAFALGMEKVEQHHLPMRIVDAEYGFDGSRLTFYFTAPERVDFRELVRDLASTFHTRIDLRQVGARDVARMVGGIGPCGRPVCCASFLSEFRPVTIRMAKDQGLPLNPEKLSGLCGRLMCCLAYELDRVPAAVATAATGADGTARPAGCPLNGRGGDGQAPGLAPGESADPDGPAAASPAAEGATRRRPRRRRRHRRPSAA